MELYKLSFPNKKEYIGITSKTASKRFLQHCKVKHESRTLCQKAIHKYGKDNIVLTVMAVVDNWELLCLAEQEAIEKFNTFYPNGYNMTLGGSSYCGETYINMNQESRKFNNELFITDRDFLSMMIKKGRLDRSKRNEYSRIMYKKKQKLNCSKPLQIDFLT